MLSDSEAKKLLRDMADDRRTAEHFLLNADVERIKYNDARHAYISKNGAFNELESAAPTERLAMRGIDFDVSYAYSPWIHAVSILERTLEERKRIFLEARRKAERKHCNGFHRGRPGWVILAKRYYLDEMELKYLRPAAWIGDRTLQKWWQDMISMTAEIANKIKK